MTHALPDRIQGLSYILPIRRSRKEECSELSSYIAWLSEQVELVVVDGSPPDVLAYHHELWAGPTTTHILPQEELRSANGKAWGVNTGLRFVSCERVVIADDDVRYDVPTLRRLHSLLGEADVVRPQNYFDPLPWHACWDTGRILLNRALGRDWPGTLGVRRSLLLGAGGYAGDVLFENLELCRTIEAAGGRQLAPLDLYVRRLPPTVGHFWSQRVRQAYDEFARPVHLAAQLLLLPFLVWLLLARQFSSLALLMSLSVGLAEFGRRRAGGTRYFPFSASLLAPIWLLERAVCVWIGVLSRLRYGGIRYNGEILRSAATPRSLLRERLARNAVVDSDA